MASNAPPQNRRAQQQTIPNKPETKLPPIPHGSRVRKRPLPGPSPLARPRTTTSSLSPDALIATADSNGYIPPPRAAHTAVIKISSGASFMSIVRRARKALDKAPSVQATGRQSLAARVAALSKAKTTAAAANETAPDDVLLVATGRAIGMAVDLAGFFSREKDLAVLMRTRTLSAVDDVVAIDEDAGVEDEVRVRNVNCLEVGLRWAS
ncbi:Rpp20 subunit of nuclear RNase MRP and P-domain-containing protein [Corynascus novoguineensis]|uniref:Rpp20 subunit of nuclear RNase MRP and P-domain-containing protein n=1 Tax=Corynascus novoguineensis TaxID=1126955 RepID=A0AAN7CSU0_9PEZI|nr:Rpp20 subunit of nuclear RNase MRP and P-domain-containing protein [Corynascus novoguineensis]